ncbi:MarR family transcriptional regulator [Streptomyces glebosus]|uniref:MarR family transcriptional regulator n=1 Tax=Streptomyces glebosus TaxID=249580 RepID=A0A640SP86_9ACTN|nr:MarR family transcriptional regulator [Streptomyces glebosus]GFE13219.1 MarR family transcriptional regulator [Streptomyces glebosus]GHG66920.1 MarR family transcriptional regulator [Streptomyces glebosus]
MSDDDSRASAPGSPGEAPLPLEDHFCFTLYAASRAVTNAYRPLLDELGLTYPQYLVMVVLWQHGTASVKDLVAALQLDYGTVTPLIKRLEANGLLRRQRRADDERVVEVALTPQGTALSQNIRAVPLAVGDTMGLTPEEFTTAQSLLRRVTANVHRHTTGTQPTGVSRP